MCRCVCECGCVSERGWWWITLCVSLCMCVCLSHSHSLLLLLLHPSTSSLRSPSHPLSSLSSLSPSNTLSTLLLLSSACERDRQTDRHTHRHSKHCHETGLDWTGLNCGHGVKVVVLQSRAYQLYTRRELSSVASENTRASCSASTPGRPNPSESRKTTLRGSPSFSTWMGRPARPNT